MDIGLFGRKHFACEIKLADQFTFKIEKLSWINQVGQRHHRTEKREPERCVRKIREMEDMKDSSPLLLDFTTGKGPPARDPGGL